MLNSELMQRAMVGTEAGDGVRGPVSSVPATGKQMISRPSGIRSSYRGGGQGLESMFETLLSKQTDPDLPRPLVHRPSSILGFLGLGEQSLTPKSKVWMMLPLS